MSPGLPSVKEPKPVQVEYLEENIEPADLGGSVPSTAKAGRPESRAGAALKDSFRGSLIKANATPLARHRKSILEQRRKVAATGPRKDPTTGRQSMMRSVMSTR